MYFVLVYGLVPSKTIKTFLFDCKSSIILIISKQTLSYVLVSTKELDNYGLS